MKILFAEPPAKRRVGGIETALAGLSAALIQGGGEVRRADRLDEAMVASADVVHFHGLWEPAHARARRWCQRLGKPFLVSPHGMLEAWALRHRGWKKLLYFFLVERPSLSGASWILATSAEEEMALQRWFSPARLSHLPLGLDTVPVKPYDQARSAVGVPPDEFVVLFLSRCHEKKGLHLLVKVLPRIARVSPHRLRLLVVGEGEPSYVVPLRHATAAWAGNLSCTWVGARWGAEKWDYLAAADIMCLPSFSENFGLAILESLFAGTPVLTTTATPWGSLRGPMPVLLIEPAADALEAALRERLHAPKPSQGERQATRDRAIASFNWASLAPRYLALYNQVLLERGGQ